MLLLVLEPRRLSERQSFFQPKPYGGRHFHQLPLSPRKMNYLWPRTLFMHGILTADGGFELLCNGLRIGRLRHFDETGVATLKEFSRYFFDNIQVEIARDLGIVPDDDVRHGEIHSALSCRSDSGLGSTGSSARCLGPC